MHICQFKNMLVLQDNFDEKGNHNPSEEILEIKFNRMDRTRLGFLSALTGSTWPNPGHI